MYTGKVFKYGDNVDTDVIIPARYLNAPSPEELARHCMEDIDADFATTVQQGDIQNGCFLSGQIAAMVKQEQPAAEIVQQVIEEAEQILRRANAWVK